MWPAVPTVSGDGASVTTVRRGPPRAWTERRRSRTFPPRGCRGSPALKAGRATGPWPLHGSCGRLPTHGDGARRAVDELPDDGSGDLARASGLERDEQPARGHSVAQQAPAPLVDVAVE